MTEEQQGAQKDEGAEQERDEGFRPITSQEDFEKALGKRLERERAKFSDYDDLKSRAAKLAEIEERDKTELQRLQERAEAAEKRVSEAERQATASRIAAELDVPVEAVHGATEDEMRASADRLAKWRAEGVRKPPPVGSTKSGSTKTGTPADRKEAAAAALRRLGA